MTSGNKTRSAGQRIYFLREFSVPLIAGVIFGLAWANIAPGGYDRLLNEKLFGLVNLKFLTNDVFMVLFFGMAAVEITRSCLPGGSLHPLRRAVNPLLATAGGILGPVAFYLGLNAIAGSPALVRGWAIPTATDIALAWLVARVIFGSRHPAVSFLVLLAVADDAIGLAIIAVFYPDPVVPVEPVWLSLTAFGMACAYLLRTRRVESYWPYVIFAGCLSWAGLFKAHLHPALALVFITPFLPHGSKGDPRLFEGDPRDLSTLSRFEHEWKIVVDFGLFLFGLVNAGVPFSDAGIATWLVLSSLFVGKTFGIFVFGLFGRKIGFPLPENVGRKELLLTAMVAGMGLTVSLFIAGVAFVDAQIQSAAKMGALLSAIIAPVTIVGGRLLKIRRAE